LTIADAGQSVASQLLGQLGVLTGPDLAETELFVADQATQLDEPFQVGQFETVRVSPSTLLRTGSELQ
jgi:hypothetical protein